MTDYSSYFSFRNGTLSSSFAAENAGFSWTGDLNGDGFGDLIVTGASYPPHGNVLQQGRVFFGDGAGNFALASTSVFPWDTLLTVHAREIVTGDFNGDGRPDVYVAGHGYDSDPFPGEQNRLYLSAAGGTWIDATANLPQLLDYSHSAAVGDVNGDGKLDIYVGNIYGQNQISPYLLLGDGTGHFTLDQTLIPAGSGQALALSTATYTSSLLADLNNDGRPELILGSDGSSGGRSRIFWNTGSGYSAAASTVLPAGQLPDNNHIVVDVAAFDINGDGRQDLLTLSTRENPFYAGWAIDIYLNDGAGGFVPATLRLLPSQDAAGGYTPGSSSTGWAAFINPLDVNRDGAMDFVISNYSGPAGSAASAPIFFLNDGTGHFTAVERGDLPGGSALQYGAYPVATAAGTSLITFYTSGGALYYSEDVATGLLARPAQVHYGSAPANDFDGDGKSDILWRSAGGSFGDWLATSGGNFASNPSILGVSTDWKIAGTGDFNGDGKTDVLWRNDNGQFGDWLASGSGNFSPNATLYGVGTDWKIAGTGDFNGDGKTDLLWRNDNGTFGTWSANADGTGFTPNSTLYGVTTDWKIAGTGDFDGDGKSDILWRNTTTGQFGDWLSNGDGTFSPNATLGASPLNWHIAETGDFNGDGKTDILWRSDAGQVGTWFAGTGGNFTPNATLYGAPTDWKIVDVGDYNADGKDDILWRNSSTGQVGDWLSGGDGTFNPNANLYAAPLDWNVAGDHAFLV